MPPTKSEMRQEGALQLLREIWTGLSLQRVEGNRKCAR